METQTKSYSRSLPVETFGRPDILGDSVYGPSMTEPGQVLTIDSIIERHVMGLPVSSSANPTYDYDDDDESYLDGGYDDPADQSDIDFSDVYNQQRDVTARINEYYDSQSDGARQTVADATATDSRASENEQSDKTE
uniref:Uncharacterized protein n=1 Tax=Dulem virus 86 TaxID=3145797 RepID=A0AAU8B069_9VIRU